MDDEDGSRYFLLKCFHEQVIVGDVVRRVSEDAADRAARRRRLLHLQHHRLRHLHHTRHHSRADRIGRHFDLVYTNKPCFALVIWAVAAVIVSLGGFCYVELATSIPTSGADFAYMRHVQWLFTFSCLLNEQTVNK